MTLQNITTELDSLISNAFTSQGKMEDVNKVYLALLRSFLFVPVHKEKLLDDPEPFRPLYIKNEEHFFMLTFDTKDRLQQWAGDQFNEIDFVELRGGEVIQGLQDNVFLCLNVGCQFYKEFSPDEVTKLKIIAAKISQMIV